MPYDFAIRASSLAEYFDCGARWQAKYLLGMTMPSGAPALIGTAVHAGTAAFDTRRMLGDEASTEEAVEFAADAIKNPQSEVRWDDFRPSEAIEIASKLTLDYCRNISPGFTYRKVEMKLSAFDIKASNGVVIHFTGKMDREYVEERPDQEDRYGVLDFKTGKQVVGADGEVKVSLSAAQIGQYELLSLMATDSVKRPHLAPAMIVAMPTAGKQKPKAVRVDSPHRLLIGDNEHKGLIDIAADIYKHDLFVGNPRSMLCSKKYCPAFAKCRWRMTGE